MSAKSDQFEIDVANKINMNAGTKATRPPGDTRLSDVAISMYKSKNISPRVWVEAKMSHTDNLANPRVFYDNGKWDTTYTTPVAEYAVKLLNNSKDAASFITNVAKFTGIPRKSIKIPTTKGGLREEGAVPLASMKSFFNQSGINKYIANDSNINVGELVTQHYTIGKQEPAYYMQAGDDFYMISNKNPLGLPRNIPLLSGVGDFKVRVSTRSEFYEVQVELKIKEFRPTSSPYSVFGDGKTKKNPFA